DACRVPRRLQQVLRTTPETTTQHSATIERKRWHKIERAQRYIDHGVVTQDRDDWNWRRNQPTHKPERSQNPSDGEARQWSRKRHTNLETRILRFLAHLRDSHEEEESDSRDRETILLCNVRMRYLVQKD